LKITIIFPIFILIFSIQASIYRGFLIAAFNYHRACRPKSMGGAIWQPVLVGGSPVIVDPEWDMDG